MSHELNRLLGESRLDAALQFRAYLFIKLDRKGTVLKIWENTSFPHPRDITQIILKNKTIFKSFDFGPVRDLDRLPENYLVYPDQLQHLKMDLLGDFYTTLPFCNISINKAGDDLFIGAVRLTNYFPNVSYGHVSAIIFVDNQDRLYGFNSTFFEYFSDRYENPEKLLGEPCGRFFSPTPVQIQKAYFTALKKPALADFTTLLDHKGLSVRDRAELPQEGFTRGGSDSLWENRHELDYRYLTLLRGVRWMAEDFVLETELEVLSGDMPIFILGDRAQENEYPDVQGYGLGVHPGHKTFFLKKRGFIIARKENPGVSFQGAFRVRFSKIGLALFLEIGAREIIRYYDFDFIETPEAYVSLGLRPGSRVRIKDLSFKARPRPEHIEKERVVIQLKTPKKVFFTFNYVYNEGLASSHSTIRSYALLDVTRFQEDVDRYQSLYNDQKRERDRLSSLLSGFQEKEGLFLGKSRSVISIKEKAEIIADSNATILIQGDTGTGKEMLARYIHYHSPYKKGPFVKVDCSTLSPMLIESELFGHEKGAFTGAMERKRGKFEQAASGTLFLDEINNLNMQTQAKILNFLQDFTVTRVGGEKPVRLDLRIIIASNIPVEEMVKRGEFRADLFFRINMVSIGLPPLRERMDDIPELCEYFIQLFSLQLGKRVRGLTSAAYKKLYGYAWPGNVRELRNVLNKAFIFCEGQEIDEGLIELPQAGQAPLPGPLPVQTATAPQTRPGRRHGLDIGREKIEALLRQNRGNIYQTAADLGITRQAVYYYLRKFGLNAETFRK